MKQERKITAILIGVALTLSIMLSACGYKDDLYLPTSEFSPDRKQVVETATPHVPVVAAVSAYAG